MKTLKRHTISVALPLTLPLQTADTATFGERKLFPSTFHPRRHRRRRRFNVFIIHHFHIRKCRPTEIIIECSHYRKAMIVKKKFSDIYGIMSPSINSLVRSPPPPLHVLNVWLDFATASCAQPLLRRAEIEAIKIFSWLKVILIIKTTSINFPFFFPPFLFAVAAWKTNFEFSHRMEKFSFSLLAPSSS